METILVVDDMVVCRQFIATALEMAGYKAVCASDGTIGLAMLEEHPVSLVVLDEEMPRLDGTGFLRAIRRDARFLNLPVILLTSVAKRDLVVQTRLLGAQDFLLKAKLNVEDLILRVKRHLILSSYHPPELMPKSQIV